VDELSNGFFCRKETEEVVEFLYNDTHIAVSIARIIILRTELTVVLYN